MKASNRILGVIGGGLVCSEVAGGLWKPLDSSAVCRLFVHCFLGCFCEQIVGSVVAGGVLKFAGF